MRTRGSQPSTSQGEAPQEKSTLPTHTLLSDLGLQNCDMIHFCCLSPEPATRCQPEQTAAELPRAQVQRSQVGAVPGGAAVRESFVEKGLAWLLKDQYSLGESIDVAYSAQDSLDLGKHVGREVCKERQMQ